ncbi:MAG: hypothetical protein IJO64_00500, partial [Clostridia bacterium]|nr:hypothetical protein [Clostridia bacterium]
MKRFIAILLAALLVVPAAFVLSASAESTLVSQGKSYTVTGNGHGYISADKSSDYDANLTDGVAEEELTFGTTKNWFGFYFNQSADASLVNCPDGIGELVIDLEEVVGGINKFRAHLGNHFANGVPSPESITVSVSENGTDYTEVGGFTFKETGEGSEHNVTSYWTEIVLDNAVSARYVKFTVDLNGVFCFANEFEVYADPDAASKPVELEWKPFFLTHFNDNTVEGSGVIMTTEYTGAVWWIHAALAPVAGLENVYEVVGLSDGTPDGSGVAQAIPEGGFVYALNFGNNYAAIYGNPDDIDYTSPNCENMINDVKTWQVGDKIVIKGVDLEGQTIPTSTPDVKWYDDAYVCTAEYAKYVEGAVQPPVTVKEEITVDGDLDDNGWAEDGWTVVNKDNAAFQGGIDSMKVEASKDFGYKFQMRTDDEKLYVAAVYDAALTEIDGSGFGSKLRLWLNTNEEATVYTHFYDVYTKDGVIVAEGKKNTELAANKAQLIENSSVVGTMKEVDGKVQFELSVDLAEFGGENGFDYFFNAGQKSVDGDLVDNIQLLYPAVETPDDSKNANFPYTKWAADNAATADVEALKLGEIVVDDDEPVVPEVDATEEAIKNAMGEANEDTLYDVAIDMPAEYEAGSEIEVVVSIKNITAKELCTVSFDLFYDIAELELLNG